MCDQPERSNLNNRRITCLMVNFLSAIPVRVMLLLVHFYQWLLSPLKQMLFGPGCGCRFQPTCSCYAHSAFLRFGFWRGLQLISLRILRCHPWHSGGYDPLPNIDSSEKKTCTPDIK